MIAYTYPLLNIFWTLLILFGFFVYFWLLIMIFMDIFRNPEMGGAARAAWVILVMLLPFVGILAYLLFRGGQMHDRAFAAHQARRGP